MDVRGIYIKGNEAFAAGNYGEALHLFMSILDNKNDDESLILKISQCYQETGSYDEAIEFLEKLLLLDIEKGDFKKAIAVCKRILSIDPDDTEVIVKLANIFRKIGQYGEASYYYRIAAQHYEYAGFMDKAIEMLQIVRELGQEGVEDLLDIIKNEYKRGARTKASRNIEQIIKELKEGKEHGLLDVALNLALSNTPDAFFYVDALSELYFKTGRLKSCSRLCIWGIHLKPASAVMYYRLCKSLWALGLDDISKRLMEALSRGDISIDDKDHIDRFNKMLDHMKEMERSRVLNMSDMEEDLPGQSTPSYLEREQFTNVSHTQLQQKILREEFEEKLKEATEDRTQIIDVKRKSKFSPKVLDGLREAEILMSEGFYDKASMKLFALLEEEPGNDDIKNLLNKALKLSDSMGPAVVPPNYRQDKRTIEEISVDLEKYLDEDPLGKAGIFYDEIPTGDYELINIFNNKIQELLLPQDHRVVFDLGIAYMEMELWKEASDSFSKVMKYLEGLPGERTKLVEAKIYHAYCSAMAVPKEESDKAVSYFKGLLADITEEDLKLSAMYYLADCYERLGNVGRAVELYKDLVKESPSYRDVQVRLSVLER